MPPRQRIRTIKPELWRSPDLQRLSVQHRLTFIGLISHADDEGRVVGEPAYIRSIVFPMDDVSLKRMGAILSDLEKTGLIRRYEVADEPYLVLPTWHAHQVINRPSPSLIPPPDSLNGSRN